MNLRNILKISRNLLKSIRSRFLASVYRHDPLGKGKIGKVMGVLLILNFILFVIVFFMEVLIPHWKGEFPPYRLQP